MRLRCGGNKPSVDDRIEITRHGSSATVTVVGELELVQGDKLEAAALGLFGEVEQVVIDMSDVSFMDSSGLGALIVIGQAAEARGGSLVLQAPTPSVMKVLELTSTASIFTIERAAGAPSA